MRVAFYAPLKAPTHGTPSGDRRVARLLMQALALAGHAVELASEFRSYEGAGDPQRQAALRGEGESIARTLVDRWSASRPPEAWFTYHLYYKAPDWLGPKVAQAFGIPYVVAEASHAPRRAGGPWALGHEATARALRGASRVFCLQRDDEACLVPLVGRERIARLSPFLDPAPYRAASARRALHRAALAKALSLPQDEPWIAVAAMMRQGDKLSSYRVLADTLALLPDAPWRLLVAGDGPARRIVEEAFSSFGSRIRFIGVQEEEPLAELYAACDLYVWPGVNEAFGMALLEAQAAGLPVVSCALRGIPDVVADGTGFLAPAPEPEALARFVRILLADPERRAAMGREAARFVLEERSLALAAKRLAALP
jgi:glycosyltransferase involved in cell wall biosynthesis